MDDALLSQIFQKYQESGQLPVSRLGDAIRSAGMNPTASEVSQMLPATEAGVTLERFQQLMQAFFAKSSSGDQAQGLRSSLEVSADRTGYVSQEKILEIARMGGHGFTEANLQADEAEAEGCRDILEAATENKEGAIRHLIRSDVNSLQRTDEEGKTPLHLAAEQGHDSVVERLLEAKAAVDAQNKKGKTPLHLAAEQGHDSVVERLLEAKSGYNEIEAIRLWKCGDGDKAVRSVCYYLEGQTGEQGVKDVQFTDNGVTELGCEFLGRTLGPNGNKMVNLLRLDYNQFGTPGVIKLSEGLSQNYTLRQLSLNYCGIGEDGGEFIGQILMFHRNAIEKLELAGNYLKERGVVDVFNACKRKTALTEINVFDNKFTDTPEVIKVLRELFANNTTLAIYDLSGNHISDDGAGKLVHGLVQGASHVQQVKITERIAAKTQDTIKDLFQSGRGKKKGKKK